MKKRLSAILAMALAVSAFSGAASASGATEIGSGCAANNGNIELILIGTKHGASSPLPVTAPTSGVITEWKTNIQLPGIGPEEEAAVANFYKQALNVFRASGTNSYTLVGESSATAPINFHGITTNLSRVPVQAGDYIGLGGSIAFYCETNDPGDEMAFLEEEPPMTLGASRTFETAPGFLPAVSARVEPDVDGDGYGDETQDQCPQSAAYQTACPVVTISSVSIAGKKAVTVHVATSLSAPVGVTATVALGKGKTATLSAATQTVTPGVLTPFTLTLTPRVTKALKALSTKKALTMSIVASATNLTGAPSTTTGAVKLKGEAKPVKHKKKPKKARKK